MAKFTPRGAGETANMGLKAGRDFRNRQRLLRLKAAETEKHRKVMDGLAPKIVWTGSAGAIDGIATDSPEADALRFFYSGSGQLRFVPQMNRWIVYRSKAA